jgi:hypothetical protein
VGPGGNAFRLEGSIWVEEQALQPDQLAMSSGWLASSVVVTVSMAAMVSGRK